MRVCTFLQVIELAPRNKSQHCLHCTWTGLLHQLNFLSYLHLVLHIPFWGSPLPCGCGMLTLGPVTSHHYSLSGPWAISGLNNWFPLKMVHSHSILSHERWQKRPLLDVWSITLKKSVSHWSHKDLKLTGNTWAWHVGMTAGFCLPVPPDLTFGWGIPFSPGREWALLWSLLFEVSLFSFSTLQLFSLLLSNDVSVFALLERTYCLLSFLISLTASTRSNF